MSFVPVVPEEEAPERVQPRREEVAPRQYYIRRKVELVLYGYTEGCPGCDAAKGDSAPKGHSDACRSRIEAAILASETAEADKLREWGVGRDEAFIAGRQVVAAPSGAPSGAGSAGLINRRGCRVPLVQALA